MNTKILDFINIESKRWRCLLIALTTLCLFQGELFALELYTIIKNGCEPETGLIINTDNSSVYMLNLEGKLSVVDRSETDLILVYNIHDNPIKSLDLNSGIEELLREVHVDDVEKTHFIGWPIRFLENLIIFFDIEGKTHLVDIAKIATFSRPANFILKQKTTAKYKLSDFGLGGNLPECKSTKASFGKPTDPTRMISDKIRVHKFLSVYYDGFAILKRFEKKTAFYARPYLYEKETRLGFIYTRKDYLQELNAALLPLYFQFSSGLPYSSQGEYSIGSKPIDLLPTVEPQFTIQSDVKSHFFTGSFIGNNFCLSAGSGCIIKNRQFYADFFSGERKDGHAIYPLFNHMALTGVDYQQYSFSGGFYYPVYGILGNKLLREIISTTSSPIFRFQRISKDFIFKVIYSQTHIQSDAPTDDKIQMIQASELSQYASLSDTSEKLIDNLQSFDLKTQYIRVGLTYELTDDIALGISEIIFTGDYSENYSGKSYDLSFTNFTTSMYIKQDFSDYLSLKGHFNHFIRNYSHTLENETSDTNENKLSFAISLEFML